jgi:hypothetical protein
MLGQTLVLMQMTFLNNVRKVGRLVLSRISCLNTGRTAVCFHKNGKVTLVKLRWKIWVNIGIKISEQPLIIKAEIPSNTKHLQGIRRLLALLTSTAEMEVVGKKSDVTGSEWVTDGQVVLKFDLK